MNDQFQNPFATLAGGGAMPANVKESFDNMTRAFTGWMTNANRMQAETIRFMNDRFNKDMQAFTRFGACKKPEEFMSLQSELVAELVKDYMEEGNKVVAMFADMARSAVPSAAQKK